MTKIKKRNETMRENKKDTEDKTIEWTKKRKKKKKKKRKERKKKEQRRKKRKKVSKWVNKEEIHE